MHDDQVLEQLRRRFPLIRLKFHIQRTPAFPPFQLPCSPPSGVESPVVAAAEQQFLLNYNARYQPTFVDCNGHGRHGEEPGPSAPAALPPMPAFMNSPGAGYFDGYDEDGFYDTYESVSYYGSDGEPCDLDGGYAGRPQGPPGFGDYVSIGGYRASGYRSI